jgi:hypothetical protein
MQFLRSFAANNTASAIGVAVIVFFIGITIAAKADSKWGYVIAALGAALCLFTLKVIRIW